MMTNWQEVKLGDVCIQITDGVHNTVKDDENGEYYLLSCKNLKNGQIVISKQERRINLETMQKLRQRTKIQRGDVLLSSVGTIGETAIVKEVNPIYEFQRSVAIFKPDLSQITSEFLFYTLINNKKMLQYSAEGAVQQCLFINPLKEFKISIPPCDIQKKIASVLSALDDKIELNNKINENLEQQAQALFKSWFVDFEPFQNGQLVDSEMGYIPFEWKMYHLSDFLPVITGRKNANVAKREGKYPFFSCSQDILWTDNFSFDGDAILVAGNGDFNVKFYKGKFEAYQRTYVLIPYNSNYTAWLFYAIKYNLSKITQGARGSVISFITKGNLENFSFAGPINLDSCEVIRIFSIINKQIAKNLSENMKLCQLRDALLPKLMSGEIDVDQVRIDEVIA